MTRLSDYMRAEVPDETEPASFYVPGAEDWRGARKGRPTRKTGGAHEGQVADDTNDSLDTNDLDESIAAAQKAAAVLRLEIE